MNRLFPILVCALCLQCTLHAQNTGWYYRHLTYPHLEEIKEAQFWGDTGVILTYNGFIYRSTDLFHNFSIDSSLLPIKFREGSCFINRDTGYAMTSIGLMYTTNGALTWDTINTVFPIFQMSGTLRINRNQNLAIVTRYVSDFSGGMGSDYGYSHNTGYSWSNSILKFHVQSCDRISQVRVVNDSTIYCMCNQAENSLGIIGLVKSTDRGVNWQLVTQSSLLLGTVEDFYFIDDTTVIATAYNKILRSKNGGVSFDTVYNSTTGNDYKNIVMDGISFVGRDTGYLAFGGSVFRTFDAGNNWQRTLFSLQINNDHIRYLQAITGTKVVVGTHAGFLYYTEVGGGKWPGTVTDLQQSFTMMDISLTPNPATTELHLQLNEPLPNATWQLYSIDGRMVAEPIKIAEPTTTISIAHLPAGVYIAHLHSSNGQWQKKIVKY